MAKIWFISNVYDRELEKEDKSLKEIMGWRFKSKTEEGFKKIGFNKGEIQIPLVGSRQQKYQLRSPEGILLPYTKMVAKGCSIRNNFYTLIKKFKLEDDDLVIYFDGDGQIDPDHTLEIAKALKKNKLVVSNRKNKPGISDERYLVEKFENSFIEEKFGITLSDVQCGCWGLKGNLLKEIYGSLNAEGFEIELDLIICSLEKSTKPSFVDIKLKEELDSTTFNAGEDHFKKLIYLMKKFNIDETGLIEKSQRFAKANNPLPTSYTALFSKVSTFSRLF